MADVLIAYNNMPGEVLHDFFEDCSDLIRQKCVDDNHHHTLLYPPKLDNYNIKSLIPEHDIIYIAAHGDPDGIINENNDYILSTHTDNYDCRDKIIYTVVCLTGQNLKGHLIQIGVKLFVGYDNNLKIRPSNEDFIRCANSGMIKILSGSKFHIAKEYMLKEYDNAIKNATYPDNTILLDNMEHLIFEGDLDSSI